MKKKSGVLILFLVIFLFNFVAASDVAYVVKNPARADSGFVDAFNEMNLEVDLIKNTEIYSVDFSKYKFIFVGDQRFRNSKNIPVNNYPSVIANRYYGEEFGLTNRGGISKLTSNSPLKIKKEGEIIQVYDRASFRLGTVSIPYYYLSNRYKEENMKTVATTSVGYDKELGDVISYSTQGANKCFFGITKTKYWTEDAKELFKECVEFVTGEERPESFCGDGICDAEEDCLICPEDCGECASVCGNEELEEGEECDDGNLIDGDGCSSNCEIEVEETFSIKINEFESNPLLESEWIELYNPNTFKVDISGWKIYDGLASEQLRHTIPSLTILNENDFYVADVSGLNNANEFVILKGDSDTQIDQTPTFADKEKDDKTWQRIPDGSDTWEFKATTKGAENL